MEYEVVKVKNRFCIKGTKIYRSFFGIGTPRVLHSFSTVSFTTSEEAYDHLDSKLPLLMLQLQELEYEKI